MWTTGKGVKYAAWQLSPLLPTAIDGGPGRVLIFPTRCMAHPSHQRQQPRSWHAVSVRHTAGSWACFPDTGRKSHGESGTCKYLQQSLGFNCIYSWCVTGRSFYLAVHSKGISPRSRLRLHPSLEGATTIWTWARNHQACRRMLRQTTMGRLPLQGRSCHGQGVAGGARVRS